MQNMIIRSEYCRSQLSRVHFSLPTYCTFMRTLRQHWNSIALTQWLPNALTSSYKNWTQSKRFRIHLHRSVSVYTNTAFPYTPTHVQRNRNVHAKVHIRRSSAFGTTLKNKSQKPFKQTVYLRKCLPFGMFTFGVPQTSVYSCIYRYQKFWTFLGANLRKMSQHDSMYFRCETYCIICKLHDKVHKLPTADGSNLERQLKPLYSITLDWPVALAQSSTAKRTSLEPSLHIPFVTILCYDHLSALIAISVIVKCYICT